MARARIALTQTIRAVRARGGIAIVIAHRPSALAAVDMVAVIQNGKMIAFGPKDDILKPSVADNWQANLRPQHRSARV